MMTTREPPTSPAGVVAGFQLSSPLSLRQAFAPTRSPRNALPRPLPPLPVQIPPMLLAPTAPCSHFVDTSAPRTRAAGVQVRVCRAGKQSRQLWTGEWIRGKGHEFLNWVPSHVSQMSGSEGSQNTHRVPCPGDTDARDPACPFLRDPWNSSGAHTLPFPPMCNKASRG